MGRRTSASAGARCWTGSSVSAQSKASLAVSGGVTRGRHLRPRLVWRSLAWQQGSAAPPWWLVVPGCAMASSQPLGCAPPRTGALRGLRQAQSRLRADPGMPRSASGWSTFSRMSRPRSRQGVAMAARSRQPALRVQAQPRLRADPGMPRSASGWSTFSRMSRPRSRQGVAMAARSRQPALRVRRVAALPACHVDATPVECPPERTATT